MTVLRFPSPLRRYLRHGMLPQLASFEAVVRLGGATRAAEALCIAQPTLSGHLRKLSEALDVPLFEAGRRAVPTAAGRVLLQAMDEVSAALERSERELAGLRAVAGVGACGPVPCEVAMPEHGARACVAPPGPSAGVCHDHAGEYG